MFLFSLREEFNVKSFHIFRGPLDAWHFLQAGTLLKTKGLRVELFQAQVSPLFRSCWSCLTSRSATFTILAMSKTLGSNLLSLYIGAYEFVRINHEQMKIDTKYSYFSLDWIVRSGRNELRTNRIITLPAIIISTIILVVLTISCNTVVYLNTRL